MPVGDRYVEVPSERMFSFLESKGFEKSMHRNEVVYARKHHRDPRYSVLVYTSVREGAAQVRGNGKDAIRVCAIFSPMNQPSRGVAKLPRVFRTGTVEGVLERILERAREAYSIINNKLSPRGDVRSVR